MTTVLEATIIGVYTGSPESRWEGKAPSAIRKEARDGYLTVTGTGLAGDQQADRTVHGGPEKAIHHYAADHMDYWAERFPEKADQFVPGCFGENISTTGLTEANLCLGDVLSLGSARVQVCQGRQPCWKLNLHTDLTGMAPAFQKTGYTGWYYRVLEEGQVGAGDKMRLIERPRPEWGLDRLIAARFKPDLPSATAEELANLPELAEAWRTAFARKVDPQYRENTSRRLQGTD